LLRRVAGQLAMMAMSAGALLARRAPPCSFSRWPRASGRRFCASGSVRSFDSGEATIFDVRALAARLQVSERKVRRAIEALSEEGLPRYAEGDHIPSSDASVIAELGLGVPLSPREGPAGAAGLGQGPRAGRPDASQCAAPTPLGTQELEAMVAAGIQARIADIHKLVRELAKREYGFDVRTSKGMHVVVATNGNRFPLMDRVNKGSLTRKTNSSVDGKALLSFVASNRDPGKARCRRCHRWFDMYAEAPTHGDEHCLGFC